MPPVDHVGIAVRQIADALPRWEALLGPPATVPEEIESQKVRVVFLGGKGTKVELLEPTAPDSPIARFLERRGEGLHHVAFEVPDVTSELAKLRHRGLRVVDERARVGARGHRVGFAHPSAFGGILVEFVETTS